MGETESMIERVARARCAEQGINPDAPFRNLVGDKQRIVNWQAWTGEARAAIEAMREPTDAMIDAGAVAEGDGNLEAQARNLWAAMIDAALKE